MRRLSVLAGTYILEQVVLKNYMLTGFYNWLCPNLENYEIAVIFSIENLNRRVEYWENNMKNSLGTTQGITFKLNMNWSELNLPS